jgi:hypothetical protein
MKEEYGWIHSCGMLHYQLDHPGSCRFCNQIGLWVWDCYESKQINNSPEEAKDVHCKNHSYNG